MLKVSLEERKKYLTGIAAKVFCEKGYQTASLADVAERAKVTKAGIYYYFPTKEDILGCLLISETDRFLGILHQRIDENKEKGLDAKSGFEELVRTYANHLNMNRELRLLILRERHQLTGNYKKKLLKREQAIFHLLKSELRRIPHVRDDVDATVISFQIISMSHWLGYWFSDQKAMTLEEIVDQNISVIFKGIFKKGK